MPVVLITGASRGLGLELARQYAAEGWSVYAGARRPDAADELARLDGDVAVVPLDVTDAASIAGLAAQLRGTPIDLLIHNAGIYGVRTPKIGAIDYEGWQAVMATNVIGPLRVTEAFLDHLRLGDQRKVATVSSRMGSIGENRSGGSYFYRASKAAVNQVMKSLSIDLAGEGFAFVVCHPGWVRTGMGGPGAELDPPVSAAGLRRIIAGLRPGQPLRFLNFDGREIAW